MTFMNSKRQRLKKSYLYIIADKKVSGRRPIFNIVKKLKGLDVGIIQFRDKESSKSSILKEAYRLRKLLVNSRTIFIINDYIDIARIVNTDGVHLGQYDTPPEIARQLLGKDKIIGVSCHNLSQAVRAQNGGADYISIGPIFPTATKPEYKSIGLNLIRKTRKVIRIPLFFIGGINDSNINRALASGARRVAICRAICQAKNVALATQRFSGILNEAPRALSRGFLK